MTETTGEYWDKYYATRKKTGAPLIPSQFAAFAAQELASGTTIVDIGCGTGRDSLFFASVGFSVLGVDASPTAISLCQQTAKTRGLTASFICSKIEDSSLPERILKAPHERLSIYARFFLHAISEDSEIAFLHLASSLETLDLLAVEFRTDRDAQQEKVTDSHFRRFISPLDFLSRALRFGFSPVYFTEGFGFAKYRRDDAHVARALLRKKE